jgi:FAD/FMN-containing dehydrogenase
VSRPFESWGRFPKARQNVVSLAWRSDPLPLPKEGSVLPVGLGRSYGDSCLNDGQTVLSARGLSKLIAFETATGLLTCEAGVSLFEVLAFALPKGWFLPVTPGTQFVTIGGAIANDIHGKNHHVAGTFGRAVKRFELLRSDGTRLICSPGEHAELFAATIGGLGMTGLITWAEVQLLPVKSALIDCETLRFSSLAEFFELSSLSESWPYTVAWVDCIAPRRQLGRGLFFRGRHAEAGRLDAISGQPLTVPFDAPELALNPWTLKLFNAAYFHKPRRRATRVSYRPFFYPLDAVGQWNRIYGRRGFLQYQCVTDAQGIRRVLEEIAAAGQGSFLAVLKTFGNVASPGLLSFPRPGVTLALDFPNRGATTLELLERLDAIVLEHQGAVYPAKDARMSGETFRRAFPKWEEVARLADPRFSSSFWRRVTQGA